MKRLTFHRFASLLHRFIASSLHCFIASSLLLPSFAYELFDDVTASMRIDLTMSLQMFKIQSPLL
jgi:hypothetical protein